ncbi:MAG: 3-oxoacid CoA-transferase subunit A [Eubacteriales bacterium]
MGKLMSILEAIAPIRDGDTILVGGFGPMGYPGRVMRAMLKQTDLKDLFFVANAANQNYLSAFEKMLLTRSRGMIVTFTRPSAAAEKLYNEGKLELIPQGTFSERIRAGGAGIPAFYTPVGFGTAVEEGKPTMEIDGKKYLLEKAIKGDVAIIKAAKVDLDGNCFMTGCTKNFGALMPAAAKYTIVEAEEVVKVGKIDPELVTVPGILIDAIVKVGA